MGIAPDIEVKLPKVKDAKYGESAHMIVREKDLERHLKNETVKEPETKPKESKGKSEDEFVMEAVPKDDKDDIQLQKAMELLKTGDIFKNLPTKPAPVGFGERKSEVAGRALDPHQFNDENAGPTALLFFDPAVLC